MDSNNPIQDEEMQDAVDVVEGKKPTEDKERPKSDLPLGDVEAPPAETGASSSSTSAASSKKKGGKSKSKETEGPPAPRKKRSKKGEPKNPLPGVNVYQMKVTLKQSKPPIWRRILLPEDASFHDLHLAIQRSMGWANYHLHEFSQKGLSFASSANDSSDEDFYGDRDDSKERLSEDMEKIKEHFEIGTRFNYKYDFGDDWDHAVVLEKIIPAEEGVVYPKCISGKRACPPEDCGGIYGFYDLLTIVAKPKKDRTLDEQDQLLHYGMAGQDYDPAKYTLPQ